MLPPLPAKVKDKDRAWVKDKDKDKAYVKTLDLLHILSPELQHSGAQTRTLRTSRLLLANPKKAQYSLG